MNILLTCAGRRNYLVQFFKQALGNRGKVIACDSSETAPAFLEADQNFIVPRMDHPKYFDALKDICREQSVRLVFSVNDLELPGLAQQAGAFREAGAIVVVGSPQTIATCQDKWASCRFLKACGIPTPDTFRSLTDVRQALSRRALEFPLLIKPRWGTSSIGVEVIDNDRELNLAYEWGQIQVRRTILATLSKADPDSCLIIQECLQGTEFGMDVVNDLEGRYVCTLARQKLVMRAGNTDRAVTVQDPRFEAMGRTIGQRLQHLGSLDCDVMVTNRGCHVLDLNPRFGGGYPFSHLAGADLPAALIAWANHEEPDPNWLRSRPEVLSAKYDGVATIDRVVPTAPFSANAPAFVS